jgi:SAM-dependent methyltransferase
MDLGCGRAADLIELALSHPGLEAHGLTIDPGEAIFANRMIRRQGLEDRVRVMVQDNAAHEFEPDYDLAFSVQVMHFIPELDRKRRLFRKLAAALRGDGVLLMAEFVSLLAKPMRDPALNTTVHSTREWAEVLGENGLVLDEVIDLSAGIANFLQDPNLERHIAALDETRQLEIRKYNRQFASLESHWVSYCVMRALKDQHRTPPEQRIRHNLERLRTSVQPARAGASNGRSGLLYQNLAEHFHDCVAPTSHPLPALSNHGH